MFVPSSWPRVLTAFGVGSLFIVGFSTIDFGPGWAPLKPIQDWATATNIAVPSSAILGIAVLFSTYVLGEVVLSFVGVLPSGTLKAGRMKRRLEMLCIKNDDELRLFYRTVVSRVEALQGFGVSFSVFLILSLFNQGLPISAPILLISLFIVVFVGSAAFFVAGLLWDELDLMLGVITTVKLEPN